MWVWARFIFWSTLSIRTQSSEMLQLSPKSGCCIKIKGVPTVAKATCELELTLSSRKSFEKRNKLTYSSDHLLLYWTAGVVKNVSKGANESFSLLILSSVDIRFEKLLPWCQKKNGWQIHRRLTLSLTGSNSRHWWTDCSLLAAKKKSPQTLLTERQA